MPILISPSELIAPVSVVTEDDIFTRTIATSAFPFCPQPVCNSSCSAAHMFVGAIKKLHLPYMGDAYPANVGVSISAFTFPDCRLSRSDL